MQRSWLYNQDPGVRAVNEGQAGKKQMNFFDNATSLPMGEGIHSIKGFQDKPGAYRRIRTDVTTQPNKIITKK